jgi:flagellar biosynthesis protein FliR
LAVGAAIYLGLRVPVLNPPTIGVLLGEVALGASMGLLAALPVYAAAGVRGLGPPSLAFAGRLWSWAIFFAIGGPALLLIALGQSFTVLPADAWFDPDALAKAGHALFYAALVLGLPTWLVVLALGPLAGAVDRLGGARHGHLLWIHRGWFALLGLILLLPILLDVLADLWRAALES